MRGIAPERPLRRFYTYNYNNPSISFQSAMQEPLSTSFQFAPSSFHPPRPSPTPRLSYKRTKPVLSNFPSQRIPPSPSQYHIDRQSQPACSTISVTNFPSLTNVRICSGSAHSLLSSSSFSGGNTMLIEEHLLVKTSQPNDSLPR